MPVAEFIPLYTNYDKSFVDFVGLIRHESRPILRVFATPERALAEVRKRLNIEQNIPVPLPICSIDRVSEIFDHQRFVNGTLRRDFWNMETGKFDAVRRPQPMKLTYHVHFWARNLSDLNNFLAQTVTMLRANEVYLTVRHPEPINDLICLTTLENVRNARKVEAGDQQRSLQMVLEFNMSAWICYTSQPIGRVELITTEVYKQAEVDEFLPTLDTTEHVDTVLVPDESLEV